MGKTEKILEIRLCPNFKDEEVISITGFSHDITERFFEIQKKQRNEFKQQERERIKSLMVLAGGIAHEYNNLLHSLGLNHSLLIKDLENQQKYHDYLDSIDVMPGQRQKN